MEATTGATFRKKKAATKPNALMASSSPPRNKRRQRLSSLQAALLTMLGFVLVAGISSMITWRMLFPDESNDAPSIYTARAIIEYPHDPQAFTQRNAVKVGGLSLSATDQDIQEFFSFSGEIEHIDIQSDNERSQIAYVTFKEPQGAETAILLSGATIVDQSVTMELAPAYEPPTASALFTAAENGPWPAIQKAEDVVSTMLAKGFILGKDALDKAKALDEKHKITSTATSSMTSLDQKIGLTRKISAGTAIVNDKVRVVDEKLRLSETTKSALAAAEQTVNTAGSAIMKNRYILTGVTWVSGAFNSVAKTAGEVGQKTKEKVLAEEEQGRRAEGYSQVPEQ